MKSKSATIKRKHFATGVSNAYTRSIYNLTLRLPFQPSKHYVMYVHIM